MIDRTPSHDLEAERSVIGALITNGKLVDRATGTGIQPNDFYYAKHGRVYQAIVDMAAKGEPIDLVTVTALGIEGMGQFELMQCMDTCPVAVSVASYCQIVRKHAVRRAIGETLWDCLDRLGNSTDEAKALADIEQRIFSLSRDYRRDTTNATGYAEVADYLLDDDACGDLLESVIPYPFEGVNKLYDGYYPSELLIVAGRESDGKSVLGMMFGVAALSAGKRVGYFSFEMPTKQVARRLGSMLGNIPVKALRSRNLSSDDRNRLVRAADRLRKFIGNIYGGNLSIEQMRSETLKNKYDVVIVDHIHRITTDQAELEELARKLKNLALEADCAVVCLAQLRKPDIKPGTVPHKPRINDIRGTGMIAAEADVVILLHVERDENDTPSSYGSIQFAKQRDGERGKSFDLRFQPTSLTFTEVA